jgi:hypothetical protein
MWTLGSLAAILLFLNPRSSSIPSNEIFYTFVWSITLTLFDKALPTPNLGVRYAVPSQASKFVDSSYDGMAFGKDTYGGGWAYHMDGGLVVGLDYKNPWLSPYHEFQVRPSHSSKKSP